LRELREPIVAEVQIPKPDHPREQRLAQRCESVIVKVQVIGKCGELAERFG